MPSLMTTRLQLWCSAQKPDTILIAGIPIQSPVCRRHALFEGQTIADVTEAAATAGWRKVHDDWQCPDCAKPT